MSYDPLDIRGQERARAKNEHAERTAREQEIADIKWLMGSRRGRRMVWRQLERTGVFRLSFNTNSMQMAFAEGNRNEGLRTLAQIHSACPELYPVMIEENTNEHRNNDDGSNHNDH